MSVMRQRFLAISFILISLLTSAQQVQACEPQPDHWFYELYNISSMLLPENVNIELSPRDSAQGYLLIANNSDLPLNVLPQDARAKVMVTPEAVIAEDGLADEKTLEEIMLIDLVPELATYIVIQEEPLQLDVENLPELVPYIEARNITDYSRPSLIFLPVTQRGEFHLVYNEQIFTVQFTISYVLRENFNPELCGEDIESTHQQEIITSIEQTGIIADLIAIVLITAITFGGILFRRKKRVVV